MLKRSKRGDCSLPPQAQALFDRGASIGKNIQAAREEADGRLRTAVDTANDLLGQMIVLGVALTIGFQAAMNIAVVTNAVPTKGIGLPFVSAGGSSLVMMSILLGLAASVARYSKRDELSVAA